MKISNQQLFWMILMLNIGINLLISINLVIREGQQDSWMSAMAGGLIGLGAAYLGARVALRYPKKTLIQFSTEILGKWLGKIIVLPYFFQWYLVIPLIMRDQFHFVHTNVLFLTPIWMIMGAMLLIIVYAVSQGGIEVIARSTQLWSPILLVILLLTFLLTINNLDWRALFPVFGLTEAIPILKGSLIPGSLLGESVSVMMLIAFVEKPGKATRRAVVSGIALSTFFIMMGMLWVIMTFGWHVASKLKYPFFDMVKLVYLMEFIQNMDIFVMAVWLVSIFVKMSIYVFVTSYGTAQWFGKVNKWKRFIWIPAVTTFVLGYVLIKSSISNSVIFQVVWIGTLLPLNGYIIPLLLLIVSVIRFPAGKGKAAKETSKSGSKTDNQEKETDPNASQQTDQSSGQQQGQESPEQSEQESPEQSEQESTESSEQQSTEQSDQGSAEQPDHNQDSLHKAGKGQVSGGSERSQDSSQNQNHVPRQYLNPNQQSSADSEK